MSDMLAFHAEHLALTRDGLAAALSAEGQSTTMDAIEALLLDSFVKRAKPLAALVQTIVQRRDNIGRDYSDRLVQFRAPAGNIRIGLCTGHHRQGDEVTAYHVQTQQGERFNVLPSDMRGEVA